MVGKALDIESATGVSKQTSALRRVALELPWWSTVKTVCSQSRGTNSVRGWGTKIPLAMHCGQNKRTVALTKTAKRGPWFSLTL